MKSMNVKKIAAIAGGAAMIGAMFVGAAVNVDTANVQNFPFFSAGQPSVKVVIGSKAKPEDVVVGANIAAVLGNLAYKEQTVEILGKDKLGGGAGGSLSDKSVDLTITTPGVNPAVAYEMKAYVEDDLDYAPEIVRNTTGNSRFGTTTANFNSNSGPKQITKDLTAVLAPAAGMPSDGKIVYPKGSTNTKEEQKVYAFAYVHYDTTAKAVQAQYVKTGYEAVFTDPIPLCLDTAKNASLCTTDSDKLSKANVEISFLGDKWTIFDYSVSAVAGPGTVGVITSVTLGKQITRKESFNIDEQVTTPEGYVIVLKDLSAFSPQRAQFDILDKDGKLVKRLYLAESESSTVSEANNIVVKVNKVFPGAFAKQGIADVSLYSSQLVLTNAQEITGGESHKNWKAQIVNATVGSTEGISKLQLYNDVDQTYKTPVTQTLNPGESIDIIKGMAGYKLNYLGLDTVDYDTLQFTIQKSQSLTNSSGGTVTGNFLYILSGKSNAFQFGGRSVSDVYVALESTQPWNANASVWYLDSNGYITNSGTNNQVAYNYKSDESAMLYFNATYAANATLGTLAAIIAIPEISEENNGTQATHTRDYHLNLYYDPALDQFVNTLGSTTVDKIGYGMGWPTSIASNNIATQETKFTTYRGNIFNSISSTSASISYAQKVARARFTLTGGSAGGSSGNDATVNLKEGDDYNVGGGYKLKVATITANVGGASGDVSGIDALVPSIEKAAVVTALNTASNPLVVLDSQASDTANLIVIGGQVVNSVASAAGVNLKQGDEPIVQVFGSTKLVVAGYSAADTSEAGNALINWLSENRMTVRGA
ncbi:S-layer protein [Candidatus Micrarchaeota archaeon]|nr:S-layer protein [Candidatus Micrarchaeota archaeon]